MDGISTGIYEEIVSRALKKRLETAVDLEPSFDKLDVQEGVRYLTEYIQKLLKMHLSDLLEQSDNEEENRSEIVSFTNRIIQLMETEQGITVQDEVEEPGEVILQVISKRNSPLALQGKSNILRPITSVSRPYLFTGSKKEPQVASELTKEIYSSDRIDLLVSFIRWTGLRIILPQLRRFTEHGGKLRIITTTSKAAPI